jgi:hypothetical protein
MVRKIWGIFLVATLFLGAGLTASNAQAEGLNGVWTTSVGDYLVLLKGTDNTTVVGLRVAADFTTGSVYLGALTGADLSLTSLDGGSNLSALLAGNCLSGVLNEAGTVLDFSAELALAYAAGAHDGIWQSDGGNYLVYLSLTAQGAPLVVVLDVTLTDLSSAQAEMAISAGAESDNNFTGTLLSDLNNTLQLTFATDGTASGKYIVLALPPQTTPFTAALIFGVAP